MPQTDEALQRTVAEELNMLRAYLDLEQARWGKRLDFTVACDAAVAAVLAYVFSLRRGEARLLPPIEVPVALRFDAEGRPEESP